MRQGKGTLEAGTWTQENIDFVPTYQGTCKNLLLGYDCLGLVSFDNDQELSLIGKGSIQVRAGFFSPVFGHYRFLT